MHKFATLLAGFTAVVAVTALAAGPALADPPTGVTPRSSDVVGLTPAETAPICDQWSHDYNAQHPRAATKLYCWGPTPPGQITTKAGGAGHCKISRPATSSAGIAALQQNGIVMGGTGFCIDFVLSTRARQATDPACASGGICFVSLMADAVTWADRGAAAGGTNAPATLTAKQLRGIYLCNIRNWSKVGGKAGTIKPFLPQSASGTRQFFLTALGGGTSITPGPCVSDGNNLLMENEGVAPELNNANAIFPYSAGGYIAQAEHSAQCTNGTGCGYPGAPQCSPASSQNLFGCDLHGVLKINPIGTTNPTKPFPPHIGACGGTTGFQCATLNPNFNQAFQRVIYAVARFSASTTDHIPAYLEPFFSAANGWVCTNAKAKTDIQHYGFRMLATTAPFHCGGVS